MQTTRWGQLIQKISIFVHLHGKNVRSIVVKKGQNFIQVVIECPLSSKLSEIMTHLRSKYFLNHCVKGFGREIGHLKPPLWPPPKPSRWDYTEIVISCASYPLTLSQCTEHYWKERIPKGHFKRLFYNIYPLEAIYRSLFLRIEQTFDFSIKQRQKGFKVKI